MKILDNLQKLLYTNKKLHSQGTSVSQGKVNNIDLFLAFEPEEEAIPLGDFVLNTNNQNMQAQPSQQSFLQNRAYLETASNNLEVNQTLFRNLEIYKPIISILQFDLEIKMNQNQHQIFLYTNLNQNSTHMQILRRCYSILGCFVKHSSQNQQILVPYIEKIFFTHMRMFPQLFVQNLLEPLFYNNWPLLYGDQALLQRAIKSIINLVNDLCMNSQYRLAAQYLQTLYVLDKYQGQTIK